MPIFSSFYFHDEIEHKKEAEKPKKLNNNFKKAPHFRKMWTRCSVFLVPRSKRYECTAVYILGPVLLLYIPSLRHYYYWMGNINGGGTNFLIAMTVLSFPYTLCTLVDIVQQNHPASPKPVFWNLGGQSETRFFRWNY